MTGLLVHFDRHWKGNQPIVPQCDGQVETSARESPADSEEEQRASGAPNGSVHSKTLRWKIPGSELYSIQLVRSKDIFEDQGDKGSQGPIHKGQIFKDKQTLKGALGLYVLQERFEYKVRRLNHTRFAATCRKRDWELFTRKIADPGCTIRLKDITFKLKDLHKINLSYNKAYRSKDRALHKTFGNPWESFKKLPAFFYMLEQSNPGTVTKFETDSQNQFTYGFKALGASILGFNTGIRPVIAIDATNLKAKTMGVLLFAVCKDGNEMIHPLAFGFTNSECTKSWTWFLKRLSEVIQYPKLVLIVSDLHAGIFAGMEDDVIKLYYRAEFDHEMAELKASHCKVYDKLLEVGIEKFSRVHSPKKRCHIMTTNIAKSINSCLLAIRKLPNTSIAEFIRDLLQRWFHDHREKCM
ncbi:hypothetical protein Dsin_002167 [Dipteronia sinensis]|uniref:MULE transposase domain-containing protein n=1 Tax=Dipteronia sinensis TaxID=43782 RepID=A0AAE0EJ49_9ROSI|nr:hypothetical protein Dsin_002167 [Dipteronia sinensis]